MNIQKYKNLVFEEVNGIKVSPLEIPGSFQMVMPNEFIWLHRNLILIPYGDSLCNPES